MRKKYLQLFIILLAFILSGCMYPEDKLVQNQTPYIDQVQSVQTAVTKYREDNGGILPIKNSAESTPIYQKYKVDFKRLVPEYLAEPPGNAYESGGVFQYVIVDAEENPTVKIFDLRIAEIIGEIKLRITTQGYPAFKEKVADNVYTLNFKELGYAEEPYVTSPYTNKNLSFVITGDAEVFVDYRSDLYEIMKDNDLKLNPGDDIRDILWQDSMFVPAYSLPYTIDEESREPIFLTN
ncbi:hypothetical protein [Bacillus benzoevorans]|uniref:Uncharacterized protein n=1 Tax=Bacillus benzoevorans TaxID=1456 RepID=A0A7X0HPX5_9BACI|nr:hypothetical protein [Bacillus benzoevorans]MBB6444708.1 hypothetical protein [Bacillus benzoevorans]